MKRVLITLVVMAVLVSVEANAQLIIPTYATPQQNTQNAQQNPMAVVQQQVLNQVYQNMITPGTQANKDLVEAYTSGIVKQMTAQPAADPMAMAVQAAQFRWFSKNGDKYIGQMAEDNMDTQVYQNTVNNMIKQSQADTTYKMAVTCNPVANNGLMNPACANIDMANYFQQKANQDAVRDQQHLMFYGQFL
jgi:hypothetical protein